jgi:hypothetical protein
MEERVDGSRNFLLAAMFVILAAALSTASDIYIAQNAAGSNSGADCGDAHSVAWFNISSNWGSSSGQIGPGTTVHLCGTFTGSAGATMLTVQGSGSSGNPVTLQFESGAVLRAPYWGANPFNGDNAAIVCNNGNSWITIDGGTNGVIINTANGTGLANQQASAGIVVDTCSHVEIKNLQIGPIYTHTKDDSGGANTVGIFTNNANFLAIDNNNIHDAYQTINTGYSGTALVTSTNIFNNTIDHACHIIQIGDANNSSTASGLNIYGNTLGPHQTEWTQAGQNCHLDGIFINAANTNSVLSTVAVYNNKIVSDMCNASGGADSNFNCSGLLYFAGAFNGVNIYNNVIAMSTACGAYCGFEGLLLTRPISNGSLQNFKILNNTFVGNNSNQSCDCAAWKSNGVNSGWIAKNNIFVHQNPSTIWLQEETGSGTDFHTIFNANVDYNGYFDFNNIGADFQNSQSYYWGSSTTWNNSHTMNQFPGYDAHGSNGNPNLSSSYVPQSGSAAIGLGGNLTSLCSGNLASLCSDMAGIARPASGAWDAGAYQNSSSGAPMPPSGLSAVVQ